MQMVTVRASGSYPVYIERGLLAGSGRLIAGAAAPRTCAVVADSRVAPLYAGTVCASLAAAGIRPHLCVFPAGEEHKNLTTYGQLLEEFARCGLTRSDLVAALGGGVTGDLAGFAAATWQRGVDWVQIPTTLLAASDASVGGKTAVNLAAGKNLAGAFHQPRLVLCDPDTFDTLSPGALADGAAETVKHALIADADFFRFLMTEDILRHMENVVRRNVEIKAAVVAEDERERGRRKLLNFGHTLGHAVEKCSGYAVTHGHAVALGMVMAARAGERLGFSPAGTLDAVLAAGRRFGLPLQCPFSAAELCAAAAGDKKRSGDSIDVVVLEEIGRAGTVRLDMAGLRAFAEAALWS